MKRIVTSFITYLFLTSCSFPTYILDNKAQTTGLDFKNGKWLLNEIQAPYEVKQKLTELALKDFSSNLNDRLSYVHTTKGLLLPKNIALNPNKNDLSNLKKGTGFDYFINIKASTIKDEFGSLDTTPHKFNTGNKQKEGTIVVEVYDLNLLTIIYSQKAVGSINLPQDNQDVHFTKTASSLILGGYGKIINDINSKSIK
ncbi:hypothetical protein [Flavobacterium humi]|uniref:Uncharacterized protein n=1 Tax=Flavobacterium humi TaxID=2562683 RepID=A0A4Z0L8C9_9FLAO|nr:hypothetical protein [Flavobacterium humi]TGD57865.1 hypothetical protein E4635_07580 [Flavobacterium humi]